MFTRVSLPPPHPHLPSGKFAAHSFSVQTSFPLKNQVMNKSQPQTKELQRLRYAQGERELGGGVRKGRSCVRRGAGGILVDSGLE